LAPKKIASWLFVMTHNTILSGDETKFCTELSLSYSDTIKLMANAWLETGLVLYHSARRGKKNRPPKLVPPLAKNG